MHPKYAIGDKIIYRKIKCSSHPTPNAIEVYPSQRGEEYIYNVDKYWTVIDIVYPEGKGNSNYIIIAKTRRGKVVQVTSDDSALRKANIIERIRYNDRFPVI